MAKEETEQLHGDWNGNIGKKGIGEALAANGNVDERMDIFFKVRYAGERLSKSLDGNTTMIHVKRIEQFL